MGNVSDRAYFLEAIRGTPMTVNEIVDRFGCAINTARNWVKHPEVERVEGSYPPAYVRKDTLVLGTQPRTRATEIRDASKAGKVMIELDVPPQEQVAEFFSKVMAAEGEGLDFKPEFRAAESQKDILLIIHKLKSAIVVSEYYLALMRKDGIS